MAINITYKGQQVSGSFDNGLIKENKPIGFPQELGIQKPYSNIFYWANAYSENGGLIDEHPHQGFEIMSFILDGEIEHYDSRMKDWLKLGKGDVQIIRAGSGISHAERFLPGGRIFQIWFDPGLDRTLQKPSSYNDYKSREFPVVAQENYKIRILKGEKAPIEMDTFGIGIKEYSFADGEFVIPLEQTRFYSCYLIDGKIELDSREMAGDDFAIISGQKSTTILSHGESRLFVVESPAKVNYRTYYQTY